MVSSALGLGMDWYSCDWGKLPPSLSKLACACACTCVARLLAFHFVVYPPFFLQSVHNLIDAFVKFFVIGHDCAHKSFSRNKLVEDIVGTLAFLPLIYPYEPWRFKHDRHHAKTNMYVHTSLYTHLQYSPYSR